MATLDSSKKIVNVKEQIEAETIETKDYFFCKVGEAIPLMSDCSNFDAQNPPLNPVVISQRLGLVFAAHSSGFCVAKIKDVVAAAEERKDKGSGLSVQELSVVDVHIGRVSILALSIDSSFVSAEVEGEIQCFSVESLLHQDKKPVFCCSVETNHVKDMLWIKETEPCFIVLTYSGTLHLAKINRALKQVLDGVDAIERNEDGDLIAVGRKNYLSIFSSKFDENFQILLPMDMWTGDSNSIKVDSIRWARSDSIVVGCFQETEDGKEENYFVQVIMNKDGKLINDNPNLTSVDFSNLFPGIVDDVVPHGCGPHLFVNYLKNGGFAFVSNRKNTDEHIMLFDWSQGDNQVSAVYIDRDTWIPRVELQESGDDNLILGLCVDESSVYENVNVIVGLEEERQLLPHCLLLCLTLEGKFIMFKVASIAGPQRSSQALSTASSHVQSISAVGNSDIGGVSLRLEEEGTKQSAFDLGEHEQTAKSFSSAPDEVPSGKDQKQLEQNKHTLGTSNFDQTIRKEVILGNTSQTPVTDVNNLKPSGQLGHSRDGLNFVGDFGMEKRNTELGVLLTNKFQDKSLTSSGRGVEESFRSDGLNRSPTTTTSSTSQGNLGVSNARSPFSSLAFPKSTVSGDPATSTNVANSSGSFFGNHGSQSSTLLSSTGKALNLSQQSIASSGISGMPLGTPSSKTQLQESGKLQNFIGQSVHKMPGSDKRSSTFGQPNSEQNLPKQFSNVQNMANEMDKLLKSIEEAGGFRDICTAAHRSSVKALEEGIDSLSESNRLWQSCTEERLREIQLLLDKTVQVLARKTHMEGIVRQTTDGQYWELWNRQKLNPELDQKQQNVLNRNQELINRMIELEKHFNTLELNLFGESSGAHIVSRALKSRSAPSRHNQSLHAIHNATISQLAAAKQLSDSLSKQMDVLSIKSPPTKQVTVKRQVFESIGIPYPDDSLCSPNTAKVVDSPSNRQPSVSHSGGTHTDSKRIHLSGVSSHDVETARRRRDSLDRNWASFEAPKTTVKRMAVKNEPQKVGSLFSSLDRQFVTPDKLERPIANYSKVLTAHDRNGTPQKLSSDMMATSKFKVAGSIPEQPAKWQFSTAQNRSSSPAPSAFVDLDITKGSILSTAERLGSPVGEVDRSDSSISASANIKPSVLFTEEKSTTEKIQPQSFSFQISGQASVSGKKEAESTKHVDGQIFSKANSKQDAEASPSSVFLPSSFSSSNLSMQTLPITAVEGGLDTSTKMAKDTNNEVLQLSSSALSSSASFGVSLSSLMSRDSKEVLQFPSAISVSAPQATPVISLSSKGTEVADSDTTGSSGNIAQEPSKTGAQAAADKESGEKSASTSSDGFNFTKLTPSSTDVPKALALSSDINKSATHVSGLVTSATEEQPAAVTSSLVSSSEIGGATGGKSNFDATVSQEDEMEEVAPETNEAAQNSLGSFAGFGIGSTPNATAPKSNPFGGPITSSPQTTPSSISLTVPSGELFRPASLSFQSLQPSQTSNVGAPNSFGFANPQQISSGSGFGQPSQIGSGQQALGSVLGSFGQSRQLGAGLPGSGFGVTQSPGGGFQNAPTSGFGGGFATAATGGGFASAATGIGGFASAATGGGGFGAAAAPSGGGFGAAAAQSGGGFGAAAAQSGGGFGAAAAPSGGGFGAAAAQSGGGFGAAAAQSGGGFGAAAAQSGGGFGAAAAQSGGGFGAAAAQSGGGFGAAAAQSGGGFGAAAGQSGGGFGAASGGAGGFGAFGKTGTSGFSGFGGAAGGRQAPSELFTQMRK